jgi:D-alanyl-lipoteichoic acid acyltransferase DltB (MBOAT superfamily)
MLFNSLAFLIFFPIVTILYFLLPHKYRWALLLGASCYFYMSFVPVYILILALTILVDYFAAIFIEKSEGKTRKLYLSISVWTTIAILFVFKYFNFFNDNVRELAEILHWNYPIKYLKLILPIGLSFHTFQSLSYVIEVYRGNQKAERHFGIYSLYVMFYPQLVAGPIERPQNLLHQFHAEHKYDSEQVMSGLMRMLWGFFKKVVIADRLSVYVNMVYASPHEASGLSTLLALFFFSFQIYCDFSGYSDIALGAAEVMGIKLMTNFTNPFISQNVSEFWRRWHISLSTWFNDYVFTPLVVTTRDWAILGICISLFITFVLSGLWHGAGWTFLIYGALHGLAIIWDVLTKKRRKRIAKKTPHWLYKWLSVILTFIFVSYAWIFFRATNIAEAFQIMKASVSNIHLTMPFDNQIETKLDMVFICLTLPILWFMESRYKGNPIYTLSEHRPITVRWAISWMFLLLILNLGAFSNAHSFIYFQF